jgi:hypothetical protein
VTEQVSLQVADALEQPFPDGQFDLVWSMESGEHMPDKRKVTLSILPLFFERQGSMAFKKKIEICNQMMYRHYGKGRHASV